MYFLKDCDKPPRVGENVRFDIYQVSKIYFLRRPLSWAKLIDILSFFILTKVKRSKELIAINVQEIYFNNGAGPSQANNLNESIQLQTGANTQQPLATNSLQNNIETPYYRSNSISDHQKSVSNAGKVQHGFIAVLKVSQLR